MNYKGFVHGIECQILIGLYEWERTAPQTVTIDVEYTIASPTVAQTDDIEDTLNYAELTKHIKTIAEKTDYQLVETLAYKLSQTIKEHFPVQYLKLRLTKKDIPRCGKRCGIEIEQDYS